MIKDAIRYVFTIQDSRVGSKAKAFITMLHMIITTASNKQKFCCFKEKTQTNGKYKKVEFDRMQLQSLVSCARKRMYENSSDMQQVLTVNVVKESTLDRIFQSQSFSQPLSTNGVMKCELLRIGTFHNYPKSNGQSAIRLAAAGFFYNGESDEVECFSCKTKIRGWYPQHVPMARHRESSPRCSFINLRNSANAPISLSEQDSGYISPGHTDRTPDITDRADYPDYVQVNNRLQSFNRWWPEYVLQSPQTMVESGFFYAGYNDCVRCFQCGIGLRNWNPQDNPYEEHAKWSPRCPYLLSTKGQDFINMVSDAVAQLSVTIEQSADGPPTHTPNTPGMATLLQTTQHSKQRRSAPRNLVITSERPNQVSAEHIYIKSIQTSGATASNVSKFIELKNENKKLKEMTNCKICAKEQASVVFIPCGHLVVCSNCAPDLNTRCLVCRKRINSIIRVKRNE